MKTSKFGQLSLLEKHAERIDLPRKRNKKFKSIFSEIKTLKQNHD